MKTKHEPVRASITTYYWTGKKNFGDLLTPLLLKRFSDLDTTLTPIASAELLCVGSVLDTLPKGWSGLVAGSGRLYENRLPDLSRATVLGLRGPLSALGVKGSPCIGDPGLLADELVVIDKEYELGIVPHWSDTELEHRFGQYNPRIIRPDGDPLEVIRKIGRCKKIVSSSLHGIILADAFGIPRRTEVAARFSKEGGSFKFRDHAAAVNLPFRIGETQTAVRHIVQDRQHEIYDMLVELGSMVRGN